VMPSWGRRGKRSKRTFKRKGGFRRRTGSVTTQSGTGYGPKFTSKKLSLTAYRKKLWDSTFMKAHYRTIYAVSTVISTFGPNTTINQSLLNADDNGVAAFWEPTGGAIDPDGGVVPVFSDDVVLRGGMHRISVGNRSPVAEAVRVEIFLLRSGATFNTAGFPTTVPVGWDPSLWPEFHAKIGVIVQRKTFLLENGNSGEMFVKRKVQKIDQINQAAGRYRFYWLVAVSNATGVTAQDVDVVRSTNLSFCGDTL